MAGQTKSNVLHDACLLPAQKRDAIVFCPYSDIALVMDEFEGRLTVVMADGSVIHRPGPLASITVPGMVDICDGVLGSPRHARKKGDTLVFPGGWTFPRVPLPKTAPAVVPRSETTSVDNSHSFELSRLRILDSRAGCATITLDDGTSFDVLPAAAKRLASHLGLASPSYIEPMSDKHRYMYRLSLRDYPYVLLFASTSQLRRDLGEDAHVCIANLIWEAVRHRWRGTPLDYGTEFRGFYYRPILPVLNRLSLKRTAAETMLELAGETLLDLVEEVSDTMALRFGYLEAGENATVMSLLAYRDPQYELYAKILSDMIGEARLITLRDLGFVESRPELRSLGTENVDWLIVVEKASLEREGRQLAKEFGASLIILGGMAKWEAAEPMADLLRPVLNGRTVRIVHYGDFDPVGWLIPEVLVDMFDRYGIKAEIVGHIVLPSRFTREELDFVAEPVPTSQSAASVAQRWFKKTNGIDGKLMGVHADHLLPYQRVRQAFVEETRLSPVG